MHPWKDIFAANQSTIPSKKYEDDYASASALPSAAAIMQKNKQTLPPSTAMCSSTKCSLEKCISHRQRTWWRGNKECTAHRQVKVGTAYRAIETRGHISPGWWEKKNYFLFHNNNRPTNSNTHTQPR